MTSDFLGRKVGQAASDFTKLAYVVKYLYSKNVYTYLIRVG